MISISAMSHFKHVVLTEEDALYDLSPLPRDPSKNNLDSGVFTQTSIASTVERRFKRRRYKRKVSLREYFRASDHFYYVVKSQFRRKNLI